MSSVHVSSTNARGFDSILTQFSLVSFLAEYDHIQLSDLEIVGTLGVGGFGRVELVQFEKNETFALKILKKHEVASQGQIEHAYSEKEIMAACDSSFIVKCVACILCPLHVVILVDSFALSDCTKPIETRNIYIF